MVSFELESTLRKNRIDALLERVQLTHVADAPLKEYSKGMLQRVGLCQSLIHDPKLIILDEPMSGLDPLGGALVRDIIVDEQSKGKTIFFFISCPERCAEHLLSSGHFGGWPTERVGTVNELIGEQIDWIDVHVDIEPDGAEKPASKAFSLPSQ